MSNDYLVKTIDTDCPMCGNTHAVEVRKRITKALIKGDTVSYEQTFYRCNKSHDEENEYAPDGIIDENLLAARNAYRSTKDLLTSNEIINIRAFYELSQSDFTSLLGWGEVTVSRYETKAIQDETYDQLMRLIYDDPIYALQSLEKHKAKFTKDNYFRIVNIIKLKASEKS